MVPPKKIEHKLSDVDSVLKLGFCSACNKIVRLHVGKRRNGQISWRCSVASNAKASKWHRKRPSVVEKKRLSELQCHKCAICKKEVKRMHWDHCHQTGKFREMLCTKCNLMLGQARDSVEILKSAINYLSER